MIFRSGLIKNEGFSSEESNCPIEREIRGDCRLENELDTCFPKGLLFVVHLLYLFCSCFCKFQLMCGTENRGCCFLQESSLDIRPNQYICYSLPILYTYNIRGH